MDARPDRELNDIERAVQAFNAGADPSAEGLMRAILAGQLLVVSSREIDPDHLDRLSVMVFGDGDATLVAAYTDTAEIPADISERHRHALSTSGENVARIADTFGLVINPDSVTGLGVTVQAGGVQQLRDLADRAAAPAAARAAREPNELEQALARIDLAGTTNVEIGELAGRFWSSSLSVPSTTPLTTPIGLDACYTFGPVDAPLLAVFTDRDQVGDYSSAELTELTGRELFFRLPLAAGVIVNPRRADQKAIAAEGIRLMGALAERRLADEALARREKSGTELALTALEADPSAGTRDAVMQAFWDSSVWIVADAPFGERFPVEAVRALDVDGGRHYLAFTHRDQIGDFERQSPYLAEVDAKILILQLPPGSGLLLNPTRDVSGGLGAPIVDYARRLLIEQPAAPGEPASAAGREPERKRGLFGRRRN